MLTFECSHSCQLGTAHRAQGCRAGFPTPPSGHQAGGAPAAAREQRQQLLPGWRLSWACRGHGRVAPRCAPPRLPCHPPPGLPGRPARGHDLRQTHTMLVTRNGVR